MGERIIVRQNRDYQIEVRASDPHDADAQGLQPVEMIHELTPYGLLLAGLGACTGIVVNTYADYHDVALTQVELRITYDRVFDEDCEDCEGTNDYKEQIHLQVLLEGDLTPSERSKLFAVSKHCPIHKILAHGLEVRSELADSESTVGASPVEGET